MSVFHYDMVVYDSYEEFIKQSEFLGTNGWEAVHFQDLVVCDEPSRLTGKPPYQGITMGKYRNVLRVVWKQRCES